VEVAWNPPGARYRVYRALGEASPPRRPAPPSSSSRRTPRGHRRRGRVGRRGSRRGAGGALQPGRCPALLRHADPATARSASRTPRRQSRRRTCARRWSSAGRSTRTSPGSRCPARPTRGPSSRMARATAWFAEEKDLPRARGATVVPASKDERLTTRADRLPPRFASGPWDTGAGSRGTRRAARSGRRCATRSPGEWARSWRHRGRRRDPQTDVATYRRADWSKMNVGVLDAFAFLWGQAAGETAEAPETPLQKLEPVDRAISELGFTTLGDVHCNRLGELYLRAYAGPEAEGTRSPASPPDLRPVRHRLRSPVSATAASSPPHDRRPEGPEEAAHFQALASRTSIPPPCMRGTAPGSPGSARRRPAAAGRRDGRGLSAGPSTTTSNGRPRWFDRASCGFTHSALSLGRS